MVTWSSICRLIWKERRNGHGGVVESMEICDDKVQDLATKGGIVDELAKLRRKEENVVWFVTVKIAHKEESCFRMLHFQEMEVGSNVVRED